MPVPAGATRDRVEAIAREYLDALATKAWTKARALQPSLNASDDAYAALYQPLLSADVLTLRADAVGTELYDLFAGQITVQRLNGATATDLACVRYRIDLARHAIVDIASFPVETRQGTVTLAQTSDQLRGCVGT